MRRYLYTAVICLVAGSSSTWAASGTPGSEAHPSDHVVVIEARPINQLPVEPVGNGNISLRPPVFAERYQNGAAPPVAITSVSPTSLVKENRSDTHASQSRRSKGAGRRVVQRQRLNKPRRRAAVRSKSSNAWIRKVLQQ